MKVFEITRESDSKVVYADDENRMNALLSEVLDLNTGDIVRLTVSGVEMDEQEYADNHTNDSWND